MFVPIEVGGDSDA